MTKKFEELLEELKAVVRKMEDPETGLDESIQLYERGTMLIRKCEEILANAEMKISELAVD
jgi:exodeoxyribonuclease VII small subunit